MGAAWTVWGAGEGDIERGVGFDAEDVSPIVTSISVRDSSPRSAFTQRGDCAGDESIWTERGADTDRGVEISGGGDRGDMVNGTVRGDTVSTSTISVSSQ